VAEGAVTPDTAIRLALYFGTTPDFWINMQAGHDLSRALVEHGAILKEKVRPRPVCA